MSTVFSFTSSSSNNNSIKLWSTVGWWVWCLVMSNNNNNKLRSEAGSETALQSWPTVASSSWSRQAWYPSQFHHQQQQQARLCSWLVGVASLTVSRNSNTITVSLFFFSTLSWAQVSGGGHRKRIRWSSTEKELPERLPQGFPVFKCYSHLTVTIYSKEKCFTFHLGSLKRQLLSVITCLFQLFLKAWTWQIGWLIKAGV